MLEIIVAILLIVWLAGMTFDTTFGGALHACIAAALVLFLYSAVTKRELPEGESRK